MRVFLDTNVLASALTARGLCAELFEVVLQSHDLLTSEPVLLELERILPGKLGQSKTVTQGFLSPFREQAIMLGLVAAAPARPPAARRELCPIMTHSTHSLD